MKKQGTYAIMLILFIVCVVTLLIVLLSGSSEKAGTAWKEKELSFEAGTLEVDIGENEVIGFNLNEQSVYFATVAQTGQLQVYSKSLTNSYQEADLVYTSDKEIIVYSAHVLNDGVLLVEFFNNNVGKTSFHITQMKYENSESQISRLFEGESERLPYVTIANISDKHVSTRILPHILLNYDNNGMSYLVLLRHDKGAGFEPTIINSSVYGRYEEGSIENGRKILFAGGYGDYVYYQVLYNSVGDPPPEVATFEATGTSVLFRYNIRTEEITRVMDLDKKALHINAGGNYALVSEYDYDMPLMDSGKLISLDDGRTAYIIPGVESGRDISASRFIEEDKVVFYTPKKLYLADLDNCVLHTCDLVDNTRVWLGQEGVHLVYSANQQTEIQYITYGDVFDRN